MKIKLTEEEIDQMADEIIKESYKDSDIDLEDIDFEHTFNKYIDDELDRRTNHVINSDSEVEELDKLESDKSEISKKVWKEIVSEIVNIDFMKNKIDQIISNNLKEYGY